MNRESNRWWIYLQERFPLPAHGPMVVVFCLALFGFSAGPDAAWREQTSFLLGVAFVLVLSLFFQLRVADEFKDADIDRRFRAHRPVPRGLVSLQELACVGMALAFLQAGLALIVDWRLALILVGTWAYMGLMTVEFFVPDWLKARPLIYLLSHMLVMPMIALLASAAYWLPQGSFVPDGLGWLLGGSFFLGIVLEIGRKLRAPADEESGVETYSASWGVPMATVTWAVSGCLAAVAFTAALGLDQFVLLAALGAALLFACFMVLAGFISRGGIVAGRVEGLSGLYVLMLYLALAAGPLFN